MFPTFQTFQKQFTCCKLQKIGKTHGYEGFRGKWAKMQANVTCPVCQPGQYEQGALKITVLNSSMTISALCHFEIVKDT